MFIFCLQNFTGLLLHEYFKVLFTEIFVRLAVFLFFFLFLYHCKLGLIL